MEKWGFSQAHTARKGQDLALWISQDIGNKELAWPPVRALFILWAIGKQWEEALLLTASG